MVRHLVPRLVVVGVGLHDSGVGHIGGSRGAELVSVVRLSNWINVEVLLLVRVDDESSDEGSTEDDQQDNRSEARVRASSNEGVLDFIVIISLEVLTVHRDLEGYSFTPDIIRVFRNTGSDTLHSSLVKVDGDRLSEATKLALD